MAFITATSERVIQHAGQNSDRWCEVLEQLGRIEVCEVQIGEMLSRSSVHDNDGSWPCQAIRSVIETVATDSICSGIHCGISNSRGVICRSEGGAQERELSTKYRELANKIRFDSPTTTRVLDGVADSYDRESKGWDEQAKWGD